MPVALLNPHRIMEARLHANMSRGDLAYAIRNVSDGRIKATERSVRRWELAEHRPSDGVVPAIAAATGRDIEFFYKGDEAEGESEEDALVADLMEALKLVQAKRKAAA